jgi:N-methylhydantoinase A/oxoprolinase/acetone carboxylase beta subunit
MQRMPPPSIQNEGDVSRSQASNGWDIAIDVGGTFVDIVARPLAGGRWRTGKHLRSGSDTADAISAALLNFLRKEGIEHGDVTHLRHGTTIATNALLELREPPVVLITTSGFADVLTLGRQNRRDLRKPFPQPLVPSHICPDDHRFELPERVDAHGKVVTALGPSALEHMLDRIGAIHGPHRAPPAIAVCLLFAPLNPVHECAVASALRARWPELHLSLSHHVDPRLREFERTLTAVLDAYIRPSVSDYLGRVERSLRSQGLPAPWIMRSLGGLAPSGNCVAAPLTLAMSGPAAAASAVRDAAARHSATTAIGIDVGGTSTDVCLIADGDVLTSNTLTLGELDIRVPSADIASVAIGGGSILRMVGGLLRAGPHSAGSNPGPACFGRGGTLPTLTDAALLAGLLPDRLGGDLALDRSAAMLALMSGLAIDEGDVPAAAFGAVKVAEALIAEAVRRKAFSRGIDPRNTTLVAAGGGGALHAAEIADRIGCRTVIVPPAAGVLAATGLTQVGFCEQAERPVEVALTQQTIGALATLAADDRADLLETVTAWSDSTGDVTVRHELDISYHGQGHSLAVAYSPQTDDAAALAARFDALHERVRGHAFETRRRILALRSIATSAVNDTATTIRAENAGNPADPIQHRVVATEPPLRCPVFSRASLSPGTPLSGPALIDAIDTTIWLPPGWTCDVAPDGTLLLTASGQP